MRVPLRRLGASDLMVSPVALGLWPIAGVTSIGVDDRDSIAAVEQALECGINHFDSAYSYGVDGRSDRVLRTALNGTYKSVIVASKVGMYYDSAGNRKLDTTPETLIRHAHEIVDRLGIQQLDLLYLHCCDGSTPVQQSAEALMQLQDKGLTRYLGVSNLNAMQLEEFLSVADCVAVQLPFNMLQQESYRAMQSMCEQHQNSYVAYWVLMKGLLAGAMTRDHQLDAGDRRRSYEIYQGEAWHRAQDFLDKLRVISAECGWSVARLVVAWTMAQPTIGSVLCGAKNPKQIAETASAMSEDLPEDVRSRVDQALAEHFS